MVATVQNKAPSPSPSHLEGQRRRAFVFRGLRRRKAARQAAAALRALALGAVRDRGGRARVLPRREHP